MNSLLQGGLSDLVAFEKIAAALALVAEIFFTSALRSLLRSRERERDRVLSVRAGLRERERRDMVESSAANQQATQRDSEKCHPLSTLSLRGDKRWITDKR